MATIKKQKNTETVEQASSSRRLKGTVTSDKMKDTIVVAVTRFTQHPKYKKFVQTRKKYMAHDVGNTKKIGDLVEIEECRPLSRNKHFRLVA
jgi:small subunit ribosomal protein S17